MRTRVYWRLVNFKRFGELDKFEHACAIPVLEGSILDYIVKYGHKESAAFQVAVPRASSTLRPTRPARCARGMLIITESTCFSSGAKTC